MNRERQAGQRGVSLIEAVVAMGVMAFGMLAVVGVQATLRGNSDVSKQRAEATRLAQQAMEASRAFQDVAADAADLELDFDEIVSNVQADVVGINATYSRERTVPAPQRYPGLKSVTTEVRWRTRADEVQAVRVQSNVAAIAPALSAALLLPQQGGELIRPQGRHAQIPPQAQALPNGTSVFVPPQPDGATSTVAWVFNNLTGVITGLCDVAPGSTSSSLRPEDVAACSANTTAQLLSGFVRFASTTTAPDAAQAESPTGSVLNLDVVLSLTSIGHPAPGAQCFDDAPSNATLAATRQVVTYFCAVFSNNTYTWAGRSRIAPGAFSGGSPWVIADSGAGAYKICRYTPLAFDNPPAGNPVAKNSDHPLDYTAAGSKPRASLSNQNFLVISAQHACPTDTGGASLFVNANTRLHQDGTADYDNP